MLGLGALDGQAGTTELGIGLDLTLEVLQRRRFAGTTVVRLGEGREVDLGDPAVAAIWVLPAR